MRTCLILHYANTVYYPGSILRDCVSVVSAVPTIPDCFEAGPREAPCPSKQRVWFTIEDDFTGFDIFTVYYPLHASDGDRIKVAVSTFNLGGDDAIWRYGFVRWEHGQAGLLRQKLKPRIRRYISAYEKWLAE